MAIVLIDVCSRHYLAHLTDPTFSLRPESGLNGWSQRGREAGPGGQRWSRSTEAEDSGAESRSLDRDRRESLKVGLGDDTT